METLKGFYSVYFVDPAKEHHYSFVNCSTIETVTSGFIGKGKKNRHIPTSRDGVSETTIGHQSFDNTTIHL